MQEFNRHIESLSEAALAGIQHNIATNKLAIINWYSLLGRVLIKQRNLSVNRQRVLFNVIIKLTFHVVTRQT